MNERANEQYFMFFEDRMSFTQVRVRKHRIIDRYVKWTKIEVNALILTNETQLQWRRKIMCVVQ